LSITVERKKELAVKFGGGEQNSGSSGVQIAIMSERIRNLTEHLKVHKRDFATRRGLLQLIGQRRRLLNYVHKVRPEEYTSLIKELELRR
jgi:small subunit ribosomal protein S15